MVLFQECFVVFVVLFKEGRSIESVGAFGFAFPTVLTIFDFLHHRLTAFGEVPCRGGATEEEGHSCAGIDFNPSGTRHTITASAAEFSDKFPAFLFDESFSFVGEGRGIVVVGEKFFEFVFVLDTPDGDDWIFGEVGVGDVGMGDKTAGEGFHTDKADVVGFAETDEGFFLFARKVGERELEGVVQSGEDGFFRDSEAVVGDADMVDHPFGFGFEHGFVKSCAVAGFGAERGIMELIDVDVVGLQKAEAGVKLFPESFDGGGHRFGGDDDVFADIVKGVTEFFFTIAVRTGGVEVIDTVIVSFAKNTAGFGHRSTLNRECAEAVEVDGQVGTSETDSFHESDLISVNFEKGQGVPCLLGIT